MSERRVVRTVLCAGVEGSWLSLRNLAEPEQGFQERSATGKLAERRTEDSLRGCEGVDHFDGRLKTKRASSTRR